MRPVEEANSRSDTVEHPFNEGSGTAKIYSVRYNEVSLYRGSFSYILLLLGLRRSFGTRENFVISRFCCITEPRYSELILPVPWPFVLWRFVISRFFFIYFTIAGVKRIVRYTEDFFI